MNLKSLLKRASATAFLGVVALSLPMVAVHAWSEADEAAYHKKYVVKILDNKPQLLTELKALSETVESTYSVSTPYRLSPFMLSYRVHKDPVMHSRRRKKQYSGIVPAALKEVAQDVFDSELQNIPESIRTELVHDIDRIYAATPENEELKVLNFFLNMARYINSMLFEAAVEEDYLGLINKEYLVPASTIRSSADEARYREHMEKSLHSVDLYLFKYSAILDSHKEEIVQRYKNCGLSFSKALDHLYFADFMPHVESVEKLKAMINHSSIPIPVGAYEGIVNESARNLDPLLRDEICKDFHKIINDPSLHDNVERLNKTFSFCQGIFAIKRELYFAIKAKSQTQPQFVLPEQVNDFYTGCWAPHCVYQQNDSIF